MVQSNGFYAKWAASIKDTAELVSSLTVPQRFLVRIDAKMADVAASRMVRAIAYSLLKSGMAPVKVEVVEEQMSSLRTFDVYLLAEAERRPTMAGYILALEQAHKTAYELLSLPWWKLAWLRWRRLLPTIETFWSKNATSS